MLENLDMEFVYTLFGGQEEYEDWFKTTLRDELERRQISRAQEAANKILQSAPVIIPPELM